MKASLETLTERAADPAQVGEQDRLVMVLGRPRRAGRADRGSFLIRGVAQRHLGALATGQVWRHPSARDDFGRPRAHGILQPPPAHQLHATGADHQAAGQGRDAVPLVDDQHADPVAGQGQAGDQPGRPGAHDQHLYSLTIS